MRIALLLALGCSGPFDAAEARERAGDLEGAAELYVALAKVDPANLGAWDRAIEIQCRRRVDVGACIGVLELELDLLGSVTRHEEALSDVLERRARARLDQGMAQAALEDLERASKASPRKASVLVARAKAHASLGDAKLARRLLDEARAIDPSNVEASALYAELPSPADDAFGGP
jgi:tetratricopeptide (TPR) repeat protein